MTTTSSISQTERQILTSFLLSRSSLSDIASLFQFTSLFPSSKRSHPQIKLLYRELHRQRNRQIDRIKFNIETEIRLGLRQRRMMEVEKRKEILRDLKGRGGEEEGSMEVEVELFGPTLNAPVPPKHALKTFLPILESAVLTLQLEIPKFEEDCTLFQEEIETAVGDMSDLRYGKFAISSIDKMVIEQLKNLYETCERVLGKGMGS